MSFDKSRYSKDLFKQFLYKFYAQIRHEIYVKIQEYKSTSGDDDYKYEDWDALGYQSTLIRIDDKKSATSYHGSSSETQMMSEETFLKLA